MLKIVSGVCFHFVSTPYRVTAYRVDLSVCACVEMVNPQFTCFSKYLFVKGKEVRRRGRTGPCPEMATVFSGGRHQRNGVKQSISMSLLFVLEEGKWFYYQVYTHCHSL